MAITETVNIVFGVVSDELDESIDKLVRAGKVSKETAAAYKELENSSKKAAVELDKLNKEFGENSQEALEAQKRIDELNNKLKKLDEEVKTTAKDFVPLRQRLKEAKEELQKAEAAFGPFSAEAQAARKNAGALADELADLNRQVGLLNPEDKIKAFSNLSQGVVASFSVATGALQAFGAENEEVQKIAQKLQGALNIVQGIQSIVQLKEAYQDVKIVLGITTAAQSALTTATTAGAAATTGATTATLGFSAALSATGIGAIVVALGALVGAFIAVENSINDAAEETERFKKKYEDLEAARKTFETTFDKLLDERIQKIDFEIEKAKAREEGEKRILQLEIQKQKTIQAAFNAAIATGKATVEGEDELIKKREKSKQQLELLQIRLDKLLETEREISKVPTKKRDQEEIKLIEERGIVDDKVTADIIENRQLIAQTSTELFQEEIAAQERRQEIAIGLAQASFDFIQDLSKASRQAQINDLEEQKEQGLISEEEYQAKLKKIKNDAAKQEKEFAVFAATLAFTEALVKALTTPNPPAALALAAAVGGLNLAKIIATPVPKFKQGTLNVGGGNLDADGGSLAMLHPGEAVIPADRNRSYHPTLKAIYEKQISPSDINAYVLNRLAGRGSIGRDTVTAKVDTYALSKAMSRNKGVQIENAQIVGKAIASELAGRINRRQML